jgi:UDP-N-acetylglucosamine:LPS N-acetylglucosamine transferase
MYFDHTAMLGGGEIALLNLIASIDRELVRPIVVLSTEGPLAEALRPLAEVHILELPEDLRRAKKDRLRIATLLKFRQVFQIARYINRLRQFIRKKEIDIVHTNSLKADIIGGLAGRLAFVPVIWHLRDRIESDYLPGPVVKVFRFLARAIPTFIVTVSEAVLNTLKFESDRTAVIHDGTTLPPLFESPAGKKTLTGWSYRKNLPVERPRCFFCKQLQSLNHNFLKHVFRLWVRRCLMNRNMSADFGLYLLNCEWMTS